MELETSSGVPLSGRVEGDAADHVGHDDEAQHEGEHGREHQQRRARPCRAFSVEHETGPSRTSGPEPARGRRGSAWISVT